MTETNYENPEVLNDDQCSSSITDVILFLRKKLRKDSSRRFVMETNISGFLETQEITVDSKTNLFFTKLSIEKFFELAKNQSCEVGEEAWIVVSQQGLLHRNHGQTFIINLNLKSN